MLEVVAALVISGGKIMVCQRAEGKSNALLWEFPGGKVEEGEKKGEAIVRECREELSAELSPLGVCADTYYAYPMGEIHLSLLRCEVKSGSIRNLEHNDIRWIAPEEIDAYPFCPADEALIKQLKERKIL
jgi:8-oxo-dGTP diphosphatase